MESKSNMDKTDEGLLGNEKIESVLAEHYKFWVEG